MVLAPTGLSIDKVYQVLDDTGNYVNRVEVSFDEPTDPDIVGYILFFSFNGFSNYYLSTHLLKDLRIENNRVFIEKTLIDLCDGRPVEFKLKAFTYYNEYSDFSNIVNTITLASVPEITDLYFDTKKVTLKLKEINTDMGLNSSFTNFRIYKERLEGVSQVSILEQNDQSILFYSESFKVDDFIVIYNPFKKIIWKGKIIQENVFLIDINNSFIRDISFNYEKATFSDFNIYIEKNPEFFLDTTNTEIEDTFILPEDSFYLYKVVSVTSGGESLPDKDSIFLANFETLYPILRRLEQTNSSILSEHWLTMKESLHDENYYKKGTFDIPFIDKEYQHLLYFGIADLDIEVWLNDKYIGNFSTDHKGELLINLKLRKKENLLKIVFSNYDHTLSNPIRYEFQINSYFIYLFFLVFGLMLLSTEDDMEKVIKNSFLSTTEDAFILNKYANLVALFRITGWSLDQFKDTIQKLMLAFNYPATQEGLEEVLKAFDVVDRFDIWEYLEPWRTIRVGDLLTSTGWITVENFLYGVSACKYNGEETTPTLVRFDKRWVDPHWLSVNVFEWSEVENCDYYKIYRGTTGVDLTLLTSTGGTRFIDYGTIIPSTDAPLSYNYSSMEPPKEIKKIYVPKVRDDEFFYYASGWLKVIVFGKREFLEGEKELIASLVRKIIPCHLKLDIVFATVYGSSEFETGYGYLYGYQYGINF